MKPYDKSDSAQIHQWEEGWKEHEQMQLQRLAALPFDKKLAWLEEAHRVVRQLERARSQYKTDSSPSK